MDRLGGSNAVRVLAVVVTHNSEAVIEDCLRTLEKSSAELDVTTVVVDNLSRDRTVQCAHTCGAEVLANQRNVGYARAVNQVLPRLAQYDYLLIANPDVRFDPCGVSDLVEWLRQAPGVSAVGPRFLDEAAPSSTPNGRRLVGPGTFALHLVGKLLGRPNHATEKYFGDQGLEIGPRHTDWLSGACLLIRTSEFASIGGFDTSYFMFFEDVAAGIALTRSGRVLVYEPSIGVQHKAGTSSTSLQHPALRAFLRFKRHIWSAAKFYAGTYRRLQGEERVPIERPYLG